MVIDAEDQPSDPVSNFMDFLQNFEETPGEFKYRELIKDSGLLQQASINILFEDILQYDKMIAAAIVDAPDVTLQYANDAFASLYRLYSPDQYDGEKFYFIRLFTKNGSNYIELKKLRARHIDKLIFVRGIVTKSSPIIPEVSIATFQCPMCTTQIEIEQLESKKLIKPRICPNPACKTKSGFTVVSRESRFLDIQKIAIQESFDELEPGSIPTQVKCILKRDLVGKIYPGNQISIMGVYKVIPDESTTEFSPYINVIQFELMHSKNDEIGLDEVKEIYGYSARENIQKLIANSIAPTILGHEHLKMAAALALFGGVRRKIKNSASRGDIHVLFVGDPGTGKSEILKDAERLSPKGRFCGGKGTSAAGLTAAVIQDENGYNLEAGVLVLCSGGHACIDEFDKMNKNDRDALHEGMEQQTISIAKADINATLNAQTSIIAAANPKLGRYTEYKSPAENINLSPPILSRFDLIFVIKDVPNDEKDGEIADFILNPVSEPVSDRIDPDLLKKYIIFARNNINPVLSDEAKGVIRQFYLELRSRNANDDNAAIAVVARNLKGYIRLAEAYARMALRSIVTKEDAESVLLLARRSMEDTSMDPVTGKIDADVILTGVSASKRKIHSILDELKKRIKENSGGAIDEEDFIGDFEIAHAVEREKIEEMLSKLKNQGVIYSPQVGTLQMAKSQGKLIKK